MANDLDLLNIDSETITEQTEIMAHTLKQPIQFERANELNAKDVLKALEIAQHNQQEQMKVLQKYGDDKEMEKKYKAMQKYGYALENIKHLLDLIPGEFEDLSLEEVGKKLEKLVRARTLNGSQSSIVFYQEMITNTTVTLLNIEEAYQNGQISSSDALTKVQKLKEEIKLNSENVPAELNDSKIELDYLLQMYEDGYTHEDREATVDSHIAAHKRPKVKQSTKLNFENLNNKTQALTEKVGALKENLSKFDPTVDSSDLYKKLKQADEYFKDPEWNPDDASVKIGALNVETADLTTKQLAKNAEKDSFKQRITLIGKEIDQTSVATIKGVTNVTFKDANKQSQVTLDLIDRIKALADNGSLSMPENIAKQYALLLEKQNKANKENCNTCSLEPDAKGENFNRSLNNEADDELYDLKQYIETLERLRAPKYTIPDEKDSK